MNTTKLKTVVSLLVVAALSIAALFVPAIAPKKGIEYSEDIARIIVATALVFLITPGLTFFYGGRVHRKNALSTMMKSVVAAVVVSAPGVAVGFILCFGNTIGGFIGNPATFLFFKNALSGTPILQGGTAMTTPALLFSF